MSACKVSLCLFVFAALLEIAVSTPPSRGYNQPTVTVKSIRDMTADMKLEAVDTLKRAVAAGNSIDVCETLGDHFQQYYPDYTWHAVNYNGYFVRSAKSISLVVDDDQHYLLFATNK